MFLPKFEIININIHALKYTFLIQSLTTKNGIMRSLKQTQRMNRKIFQLQQGP